MPRKKRREREPVETVDYTDPEGNVLTLRQSLSPKTISTYRARVLQKMNLSSNADLIRYALQNQLA